MSSDAESGRMRGTNVESGEINGLLANVGGGEGGDEIVNRKTHGWNGREVGREVGVWQTLI